LHIPLRIRKRQLRLPQLQIQLRAFRQRASQQRIRYVGSCYDFGIPRERFGRATFGRVDARLHAHDSMQVGAVRRDGLVDQGREIAELPRSRLSLAHRDEHIGAIRPGDE
jgi:hypothetical protein